MILVLTGTLLGYSMRLTKMGVQAGVLWRASFFSICCLISGSYEQALCTFLIPTFQIMAENVQYLSELSLEGLRKQ